MAAPEARPHISAARSLAATTRRSGPNSTMLSGAASSVARSVAACRSAACRASASDVTSAMVMTKPPSGVGSEAMSSVRPSVVSRW